MSMNNLAWESYSEEYQDSCICTDADFHYALCVSGDKEYRILPDLHGANVCDVGSGTGENAAYLAKFAKVVVGLDPSKSFVKNAVMRYKNRRNLFFKCTDFLGFDIMSVGLQPFDLVTFIQSLDYMCLDERFFSKLNTMTKCGAHIVISKMHPIWTTLFDHELGDLKLDRSYFHNRVDAVSYGNVSFQRIHYSLDEFIGRFVKNGWQLEILREPQLVSKDRAALIMGRCYEDVLLMERMGKYPMTLLLRFERKC